MEDIFSLKDKIIIITGGAGLLGKEHAKAIVSFDGVPVLVDIAERYLEQAVEEIKKFKPISVVETFVGDITKRESIEIVRKELIDKYGHIDGLINNAANNPKMEIATDNMRAIQFENFPVDMWNQDIAVGLTGALLCSQVFGEQMAKQGNGVILNISSDLGIIAPDQRIYRKDGLDDEQQVVKPVTYSVVKHGLIGLTKYLATYYADKGVRVNAICPAGVYNGQAADFVERLSNLIPMGRMAELDEYRGTIVYMLSDASGYMTGSTVVVDGGRTCW